MSHDNVHQDGTQLGCRPARRTLLVSPPTNFQIFDPGAKVIAVGPRREQHLRDTGAARRFVSGWNKLDKVYDGATYYIAS
jgi:hypothetical protein